jgi:hypothetical protein
LVPDRGNGLSVALRMLLAIESIPNVVVLWKIVSLQAAP